MASKDSTALAVREADVTKTDLSKWSPKHVAVIQATVAKGATPEQLRVFLAQAATLNLNPLNGEIWCARMGGENGSEGGIAIMVGEQGRLKVANRYPDYNGYRSDVVRRGDRFMKLAKPEQVPGVDGGYSYVEHSYSFSDERGEVVGAWCEVYRKGKPPVFFFAPLDDYMPKNATDKQKKFVPWFKTLDRQIVKCAISTAFRMAFPLLAGTYGEEEMAHRIAAAPESGGSIEDEIEWGDTEETAQRVRSCFNAANNTVPGAYPEAKIMVLLAGKSDEERYMLLADQIIPFIEEHGGAVPEPGEDVVADSDVEVVTDDEPDGEPVMPEDPDAVREAERLEADER